MAALNLRIARCRFAECLAELIGFAVSSGYEVALAEGLDRLTEKDPTSDHMYGSLHEIGLAQDLDLYKDGEYLHRTEDHALLGRYWEEAGKRLGLPLAWGGRFNDGNHYSLEWKGRK